MNFNSKINQFFNRDIYIPNKKEFLVIAVMLGVIAYLELDLLQPWDTYSYKSETKDLFLAGYGILESLVFLIAFALPVILYRRGKEGSKDKIWKLIVLFIFKILIIAISIDIYHAIYFDHDFKFWLNFTHQIRNVLTLGLFPFSILFFWLIYKSSVIKNPDLDKQYIVIKSSQRGSDLKINLFDILYIKSDRNYLEINYLEDGVEKLAVHRGSLSAMIDQLPKDLFCRIHNSYLVRLSLISTPYTVNSTYFVRLNSLEEVTLPVSRTYLKAVREELSK